MKNFKLSKQSIFTLLGILVIVGSIPLAVILVKQRQEIRKEAATQDCGHMGGNYCSQTSTCPAQYSRIGQSSDCVSCCTSTGGGGGTGLQDCGHMGGDKCSQTSSCPSGYSRIGQSSDCLSCCKSSGTGTGTGGGTAQGSGRYPVWGLLQTGRICSVAATPTPTQKPPAPTPTTPTTSKKSCNQTCTDDSSCQSPLKCLTRGTAKYCLNSSCPTETDCTCPGPTPTSTVTPTPTSSVTSTPTPTSTVTSTPTPTPTTVVGCDQSCTNDDNCNGDLICSSGHCRNKDCTGETDCSCPGPTSTPTSTPTNGPTSTPTTTVSSQATPTPVQLPQAGFAWPTFGAIFGGMAFILIASLLFLL